MNHTFFELYLIRHGKTKATEKKLYCGNTDLPLSRKGRKELQKTNKSYPPCAGYFTSGMRRCNETLEIILGENLDSVDFTVLPFLKEMNLGVFDMKSYEDLKTSPEYIRWLSDKSDNLAPPGGESKNMFNRRVSMGLLGLTERIMRFKLESAMCITHGGVIAAIMQSLFLKFGGTINLSEWQPEPGKGFKLVHSGEEGYVGFERL